MRAGPPPNNHARYYALVFVLLFGIAAMAMALGFISPDSWNYLYLAHSVRQGHGCTVAGAYYATYPCGYPLLLAMTAPSADLFHMVLSSKVTNFLLMGLSFLLLRWGMRSVLVPTIIVFNPISLMLYEWTWSENMFLLAFSGSFCAISQVARGYLPRRMLLLLGMFLLLGCASRYVFGPYAALLFLVTLICYGTKTAVRVLPAFVVAGACYLTYQKFNIAQTGFATGMPRIPAPENLTFLCVMFLKAWARDALLVASAVMLLLLVAYRQVVRTGTGFKASGLARDERDALVFIALSGAAFLLLAFVLRLFTQYDEYGSRTIGYGSVLTLAAATGWGWRLNDERHYPVLALLTFGLYSALVSNRSLIPLDLYAAAQGSYVSPAQAMQRYRAPATDAQVIVSFYRRPIASHIADRNELYFGDGVTVLRPAIAPYAERETLAHFLQRVRTYAGARCVFDFHPFPTYADFQQELDGRFPIGLQSGESKFSYESAYDAQLRDWLLAAYRSMPQGGYVSCRQVLNAGTQTGNDRS